jgi:hypothetical protein
VFAPDGRRAAWANLTDYRLDDPHVSVADLDSSTPRPRTRDLPEGLHEAMPVAFSADGTRLLALERNTVVVVDVDGTAPPLTAPLPSGPTFQGVFRPDGSVRLFSNGHEGANPVLRILEFDVTKRTLIERGRLPTRGNAWVRVSPDGERLIVTDHPDHEPSLTLHAMDGSRIAVLAGEGTVHGAQADFLADGGIALVQQRPGPRLRLFSSAGIEQREVELGTSLPNVMLGGEPVAGQLVVGLGGPVRYPPEAVLVDVEQGRIVQRLPGLMPLAVRWFISRDAGSCSRAAPGSAAASLFRDESGNVVSVDFDTGARETVFRANGG